MHRCRSVVSVEGSLTSHCLSPVLCSVFILIAQHRTAFICTVLKTQNTSLQDTMESYRYPLQCQKVHKAHFLHADKKGRLTLRPYLSFICLSSLCLCSSLSSLLRTTAEQKHAHTDQALRDQTLSTIIALNSCLVSTIM